MVFNYFFLLMLNVFPNPFALPQNNIQHLMKSATKYKSDIVILKKETFVFVKKTGASETYERIIYKPLTNRGLALLSVHRFDFDEATNIIDIVGVYQYDQSGKRTPLKYSIKIEPQPAGWILWKFKMKILTIPVISENSVLEIVTRKKGFMIAYLKTDDTNKYVPPMKGHFYDQVLFGHSAYPILVQSYTVNIPKVKNLQYKEFGKGINSSLKYKGGKAIYSWRMKDLPPLKYEFKAPYSSDNLPKIVMATIASWYDKSKWFYDVNKNQFKVSKEISQKVKEILKGVRKKEEKIKKLTYWVANNIRYRGFSNGKKEGYTLHSGIQVFKERAGVCKDIASMLVTMLRAAGFTVYPAMTMAGARVENVPADQFNHSVVALRNDDGTYRMLDPTWAPASKYTWSYAEREQHYLVGSPKGENLSVILPSKPENNSIFTDIHTQINLQGKFISKMKIKSSGYPETSFRRMLVSASFVDKNRLSKIFVKKNRFIQKTTLKYTNPMNFYKNLILNLKFQGIGIYPATLKNIFVKPFGLIAYPRGRRFFTWLNLKNEKRTRDVLLRCNQKIVIKEKLLFKKRIKLVDNNLTGELNNPQGKIKWSYKVQGKILLFYLEFIIKHRRISPSDYADLMIIIKKFKEISNHYIEVEYK